MRFLIPVLLLAVSVKANFGEAPDLPVAPSVPSGDLLSKEKIASTLNSTTSSTPKTTAKTTTTTTTRSPLPFGNEISKDILKFAENLIKETLQLKTFKCHEPGNCFPVDLPTLKTENHVAILTFLQHIYNEDFENIMKNPAVDENVWSEALKIRSELQTATVDTILMWSDIWAKLENRTIFKESFKKMLRNNLDITTFRFIRIMDIQTSREALNRTRRILNPALAKKTSDQVLRSAPKNYDTEFLDNPLFSVSSNFLKNVKDKAFAKKKAAAEVEELIQRIFIYIFKVDPAANKLDITGFDDSYMKFTDLSLQTLVVFKVYLLKTYGSVLNEIPLVPMTSSADRHEKLNIAEGIQDIWSRTVDMWMTNSNELIQEGYKKDPEFMKLHIRIFAVHMGDFLELDELRQIHRKTLSLLGKAFDVINSEANDFNYADLGLEKNRQVEHKADTGIKAGKIEDISSPGKNENMEDNQDNVGTGEGEANDQAKESEYSP